MTASKSEKKEANSNAEAENGGEETFVDPYGFGTAVDGSVAMLEPVEPVDRAIRLEEFGFKLECSLQTKGEYRDGTFADISIEIEHDSVLGPFIVVTPRHADFPIFKIKPQMVEKRAESAAERGED